MKHEEYISLVCESFWMQRFFDLLPPEFTPRRELRIQNLKLQRLWDKIPASASKTLGSASLKKLNKQIGECNHKCYQQAKLVRSMMMKAWQEAYREAREEKGEPYTKKAFKAWFSQYETLLLHRVEKTKRKILETERGSGISAIARLLKAAKVAKK